MLVHGKNCSNPNNIDEQLQLVIPFVLPQGDQFNYFFFELSPHSQEGWWGVFFAHLIPQLFGFLILIFELTIPSYAHVHNHLCIRNTFILILPTFIIVCNIPISMPRVWCTSNTLIIIHPKFNHFVPYPYHLSAHVLANRYMEMHKPSL